ncbi:MAG: GHKL domain-containing protein [Clostridia bacterium]|nr:GHKL domain-containing protein [Clostridia bacterium]
MNKKIQKTKSVRLKLFLSLCIVIVLTIIFLIIINNIVLEAFYTYNKKDIEKNLYEQINEMYNNNETIENIREFIKEQSTKNNLDIFIKNEQTGDFIASNQVRVNNLDGMKKTITFNDKNKIGEVLHKSQNVIIKMLKDYESERIYIVMLATLDNGAELFVVTPISAIKDSLRVSNQILVFVGIISVLVSAVIALVVSKHFSDPILDLNGIAKKMTNLDFSQKYIPRNNDDELDELGKRINILSDTLEHTITELKANNNELERDIKEKSKIDEMRTQFISDVSHELKTPIALIQGYAEGLIENVNDDDESRKFYAEVILDEADKMDKLVKQLLELMKLEYGKREFDNKKFDIVSLIQEDIRKCDVMIKEQNIDISFENKDPINVFADDFYIEQVVTNYLTNAIKYSSEVNGKRAIVIDVVEIPNDFVRVSVYNTGKNFSDDEMKAIWGRFYKVDSSRNRENGGTGIGLSFVKAVMNNYKNKYGVKNKNNGVEFYFELKKA